MAPKLLCNLDPLYLEVTFPIKLDQISEQLSNAAITKQCCFILETFQTLFKTRPAIAPSIAQKDIISCTILQLQLS